MSGKACCLDELLWFCRIYLRQLGPAGRIMPRVLQAALAYLNTEMMNVAVQLKLCPLADGKSPHPSLEYRLQNAITAVRLWKQLLQWGCTSVLPDEVEKILEMKAGVVSEEHSARVEEVSCAFIAGYEAALSSSRVDGEAGKRKGKRGRDGDSKLPTKSHHKNEKCSPDTTIGLPTAVLQQLPPMHVLLRGPHGAANDYSRQLLANGLSDYLCRCTEEALTVCCTDAMYLPHQVAALATVHEKVHFVCALAFPTEGVLLAVEDVWKQDKYVKGGQRGPYFLAWWTVRREREDAVASIRKRRCWVANNFTASLVFVDSRKSLLEMQVEDAYNGVLRSELAANSAAAVRTAIVGRGKRYQLMRSTC